MEKVVVLMSAYNGEKYIKEQIESILNQQGVEIYLIIRDDGSTDQTKLVLSEYKNNDDVRLIFGHNIGWKKSFFSLLETISLEDKAFYAFADQDDIWLPNKLNVAVKQIKRESPSLYYSNITIINNQKEVLGSIYTDEFVPSMKMPQSFFDGDGVGATVVFNSKLLSILKKYKVKQATGHDAYLIALCHFFGTVVYDCESYIMYRRHGNNVTGFGKSSKKSSPNLFMRYKKYKKGPKKVFSIRAQEILAGYQNELSQENIYMLQLVANYQSSNMAKFRAVLSPRLKATGLRRNIQLRYRLLFNTL
ncbi:glycosyltransferase [Latilactobacillus curvatus]|uniref:glycosyltransferase n=1 Tax=Latilactobacillus curvatus TaxID=28038 RepID=UPI0024DFA78E|nr:glycosyltransferase [Latilactobacillus curvatus]WIE01242.1 glycosyltransferase [Latilactobacillus curvatus]